MGRRTFAANITPEQRAELNKMIRVAFYGKHDDIFEWCQSQGIATSRSALNRYAMGLREADGKQGASSISIVSSNPSIESIAHLSRRQQLLIELGELRLRELTILKELEATP